MIDRLAVMNYSSFADLDLEDSDYAEFEKTTESPCSKGVVFQLSKWWSSQIFRLIDLPHSVLPSWALFISAVSTTIDSLLKSAGCTVKIGLN